MFSSQATRKCHLSSDRHTYNIYRKFVVKLPVINSDEYEERLREQNKIRNLQSKGIICCMICEKRYRNWRSYETHLKRETHQSNAPFFKGSEFLTKNKDNANQATNIQTNYEEWDSELEDLINTNNCLFCTHQSSDLIKNLKHMHKAHKFHVPDLNHCRDLQGLIDYLAYKIIKSKFLWYIFKKINKICF